MEETTRVLADPVKIAMTDEGVTKEELMQNLMLRQHCDLVQAETNVDYMLEKGMYLMLSNGKIAPTWLCIMANQMRFASPN